ncbi:ras-related protein Rab-44 isoform X2 [Chaetodon trifascialis]|uniref:ras-related protein Rab-44 isoform X2 n=1 Tax=Chaetodon trifascialis TaxID=109706 RepID=UPI00399253FA
MISNVNDRAALLPEQSASHHGKADNPVKFVQVADTGDSERNITVDGTNTGIIGGSFVSLCETTQSIQNNEEMPEGVNVMQDRALKSAEAPVVAVADLEIMKSEVRGGAEGEHRDAQASTQELNVSEGAHDKNLEMKDASPNLNSANRRRKLGSTRRNLGSRSKGEDSHQKQEVDREATEAAANIGDVKSESFLGVKEKEELQLHIEDKDSDSEQRKEKVFETVERSQTGESHFKPPAQQTIEVNPVSHGQLVETEHQLTPSHFPTIPPTSPKHDGGEGERRRRKLGSHRKSRGHQSSDNPTARGDRIIDTQNRRDVRSVIDESATSTTEGASLGLDKISEVDESDKKPSSSVSTSEAGEHSRRASETTPVRVTPVHPDAEIHLVQDSQKTFSLGSSRGAALPSNRYNVLMVGDSSVGKTSFMKRAQSGKFSLDLPASIGLDSCMWTVVVDGKPVVLQLWDTAGQERFHSITRQIFHKAQAFLLMYDITSSQSFSAVSYWANCIQEGAPENVTILLLGNKSDRAQRAVKPQEGEILAKEYNFEFMECSAATGENVIRSLETVARMLSQKADTREETTVLHKEPQQKKSSGCC